MFDFGKFKKLQKEADAAIKQFYETQGGKLYFRYLKEKYVDMSCFDATDTKTLINLAKKELIEDLYKQATGQLIIEPTENPNND